MPRLRRGRAPKFLVGVSLVLISCQVSSGVTRVGPEAAAPTRLLARTAQPVVVPKSTSEQQVPEAHAPALPDLQPSPRVETEPIVRGLPELESFYLALDALREQRRDRSVRILWLGDSHTAADFMTHALREYLDAHLPAGGPGFLRLGLEGYRHGAVRIDSQGPIFKAPYLPAQRTRVLDGVFGYGGIRTRPHAGATIRAALKEKGEQEVTWTLSYRLEEGAGLEVRLGEQVERLEYNKEAAGGIQSTTLKGSAQERFVLRQVAGDPEVFGVFCEFVKPGVVLDTNGINGARAATPLAWEPTQFQNQVRERDPELLVLAYGTNEVFDRGSVDRYETHLQQLIARVREGKKQIACWVIGPPDSSKKSGGSLSRVVLVTEAQRRAALEAGCAFTSAYELMGGEGSYSRWAKQRPALARSDHVHLSILGYQRLGMMLAGVLLPDWTREGSEGEEPGGESDGSGSESLPVINQEQEVVESGRTPS